MGNSISSHANDETARKYRLYRFWLSRIKRNGKELRYAPVEIRSNKDIVMAAVKKDGFALKYASPSLQNDKEVVIAAIQNSSYGYALQFASPSLQNDREVVMVAVKNWGGALQFASPSLQNDKEVVMAAVKKDVFAIKYASPELRFQDKEITALLIRSLRLIRPHILETISEQVEWFKNASSSSPPQVRQHKEILAMLIRKYGRSTLIDDISPDLRNNKGFLLGYIQIYPDHIRHIPEELKRDPDILTAAGMLDDNHVDANERLQQRLRIMQKKQQQNNDRKEKILKKIVLSTRFSLNATSRSDATNFTSLFKQNEYIQSGNFKIYAPNAFDKKTCDPNWTDYNHPCRGTMDTCPFDNVLTKEGHPTDQCCWRYSFRSQLLEAKESGGFMIQVIERDHGCSKDPRSQLVEAKESDGFMIQVIERDHGFSKDHAPKLGMGQRIEFDMAKQLNVKIFHMYRQLSKDGGQYKFTDRHIDQLVASIQSWYDDDDYKDMALGIVRPTTGNI